MVHRPLAMIHHVSWTMVIVATIIIIITIEIAIEIIIIAVIEIGITIIIHTVCSMNKPKKILYKSNIMM